MRKFILMAFVLISLGACAQDTVSAKPKLDPLSEIVLEKGASISKYGVMGSPTGRTYTEIYEVVTDSIVYRFGMEFKADSTFVRLFPMQNCDRKFYDSMKRETERVLAEQDEMREETIEFINRYRTSYEVWKYFKLLGIFGR